MIRWIRERLGTGPYEEIGGQVWSIVDARHLVDKGGNPTGPILSLIQAGVRAFQRGETVVVACDFGISRSNAIAAGILSLAERKPYDAALRDVIENTEESEIKVDLAEAVRIALGEGRARSENRAILVTGAGGFIGGSLVPRLARNHQVLGPLRSELDLERGAVPLADYCSGNGVGTIVHLAYPRVYTNASAAGSSIVMLRNVIDACRVNKMHLVFVSSWVVFNGFSSPAMIADESTPMRPKGAYAETKYVEELLVDLHFQRGNIERSICRFAPIYGPGGDRPRFIRTFYDAAVHGRDIKTHRFRNGRPALDLLHVSDAVEAIVRVVQTRRSDIVHFGTGELRSTADVAALICGIAGRSVKLQEMDIDDDTSNIAFPSAKARMNLGWEPKVSLERGLSGMLAEETAARHARQR
jgi:nucleoside-diphosphate-sugar epimerase